ncbi:MAG: hypothetical protein ACE3JK_01080 [Sporolactobacillus sp.]
MLSKEDREMMIDFLILSEGCTRKFWDRQSDKIIELNYRKSCLQEDEFG